MPFSCPGQVDSPSAQVTSPSHLHDEQGFRKFVFLNQNNSNLRLVQDKQILRANCSKYKHAVIQDFPPSPELLVCGRIAILFSSDKSNCKPQGAGERSPLASPLSLTGRWDGIFYWRAGYRCVFRWMGEGKIEKTVLPGCGRASLVWRELHASQPKYQQSNIIPVLSVLVLSVDSKPSSSLSSSSSSTMLSKLPLIGVQQDDRRSGPFLTKLETT